MPGRCYLRGHTTRTLTVELHEDRLTQRRAALQRAFPESRRSDLARVPVLHAYAQTSRHVHSMLRQADMIGEIFSMVGIEIVPRSHGVLLPPIPRSSPRGASALHDQRLTFPRHESGRRRP